MDVQALAVVPFDPGTVAQWLAQALTEAGLDNPVISVSTVDHLQRNPETGKLRRFVPLQSGT
jgi:hypothetical protein